MSFGPRMRGVRPVSRVRVGPRCGDDEPGSEPLTFLERAVLAIITGTSGVFAQALVLKFLPEVGEPAHTNDGGDA